MAVIGVVFKACFTGRFKLISVGTYMFMGWLGLPVVYQLYQALPAAGFALLVAGGLAYSIGVIFYVNKNILFNHAIWHCFVFVGAASHYWLIAGYVLQNSRIA
jgi:hemolysin III